MVAEEGFAEEPEFDEPPGEDVSAEDAFVGVDLDEVKLALARTAGDVINLDTGRGGERMRILVFLHGTTIMHQAALGHTREERVEQVKRPDPSVTDYAAYVPVSDAVAKLAGWQRQGDALCYLSSHQSPENVAKDAAVLERFGFPPGEVLFRQPGETYADAARRAMPDVLIEDDCESIGGEVEMTYPHLRGEEQERITGIVVREFEGIDHLPDSLADLRAVRGEG